VADHDLEGLTDPEFIPKMRQILDLYDHPPTDGRVISVDEFGPLNLLPRTGKTWQLLRCPRRLRATYTRTAGVMHMLAALDLATGKLFYRIRARKRWLEFLDLLKTLRARWPSEKLYVVCDNFSPHHHATVTTWRVPAGPAAGRARQGRRAGPPRRRWRSVRRVPAGLAAGRERRRSRTGPLCQRRRPVRRWLASLLIVRG
jgi:hypothetical protein